MVQRTPWAQYGRYGEAQIGPFALVFFTDKTSDKCAYFFFPVAPTNLAAQYAHAFSEFEIVGLGEAAMRGGDRLAALTLESFFPRDYDPLLVDGLYDKLLPPPTAFEERIHAIRIIGRPCQLIIGGTNIDWTCMIREFRVEHRGGEPGDIYFSLSLKKHRLISLEKREAGGKSGGTARPNMSSGAPNIGKAVPWKWSQGSPR